MVLLTLKFYFHLLNYLCLQFFACSLSCRKTHEVDNNICGAINTDHKLCKNYQIYNYLDFFLFVSVIIVSDLNQNGANWTTFGHVMRKINVITYCKCNKIWYFHLLQCLALFTMTTFIVIGFPISWRPKQMAFL